VPRDAVILGAKPLEIHFTRLAAMTDFALTNDLPGALAEINAAAGRISASLLRHRAL